MNATADDHALTAAAAAAAGELLMAIRAEGAEAGRALGDRGDREANLLILDLLRAERPHDAFLSEESADDPARCTARRAWIIDPLDGTREYAEGRGDWAVHVALAIDGCPVAGAVALPALGRLHATTQPPPAPARARRPRMVVSRSRPPELALSVAAAIDAELIPMGSAGAKAMAVVEGVADIYLHAGGQYEWDNCAPAAVALAAGLHASRIDGAPLRYNRPDPYLPDLLFCHPADAPQLLDLIRGLGDAS